MVNFTPDDFNLPRVPNFKVIDNVSQWTWDSWTIKDIIDHWSSGQHCQYFDPTTGQWSVLWPARAVWMETADPDTPIPNVRLVYKNGLVKQRNEYEPPDPEIPLAPKDGPKTKKPNVLARLFTKG